MGVSRAAEPSTKTKKRSSAKSAGIPLSAAMILVTLGVVYGDIGTSPMYTLKAIMSGNGGLTTMSQDVVIGALSLVIWTMTLIATVKYVLVAMKADNHNEGGIFALYSLVKRCAKWLIIPAMVGGAALLADGILTPAVTVTTAIEGLRTIPFFHGIIGDNQNIVVLITIAILCVLFAMQHAGTSTIGKAFGPIMTIWFLYLGIVGLVNVGADLNVFRALNPLRGITFLFDGNLVFLTNDSSPDRLDRDILYSILDKRPKRARAYFFLTIQVTDEPYTHEFSVNTFGTDFIFKVQIRLGFRVNQRVNEYLYQIVEKLVQDNMIAPQHHKYSIYKKKSSVGDFRFCLVRKVPSSSADISAFDRNIISAKYIIRRICGSPAHWYGLENSSVIFEYVPLFARTKRQHTLDYVELPDALKRAGLAYDEGSDEYVALHTGRRVQLDDAEKYFDEEEEDVDLFDAAVRKAHDDEARYVEDSIIGGDTAVFRPVSADDEEDEGTEENED